MAVKKREKPAQARVMSAGRKAQDKSKASSSQKMKNAGEKEAKQNKGDLPVVLQFAQVGQFLREVQAESRKISWPERAQVIRETVSVLFLVALITFFVWAFDLVVGKFVFAPLEHWGHLYGIGGG